MISQVIICLEKNPFHCSGMGFLFIVNTQFTSIRLCHGSVRNRLTIYNDFNIFRCLFGKDNFTYNN